MKITASSDWRDAIPFDTPVIVAEVAPGEPTRCMVCGADSEPRDRSELWAVKHRHPKNHSGFVRFYCLDHRPEIKPAPVVSAPVKAAAPRRERAAAAPRRPAFVEIERAKCPDCFIEVSATGECGMCGQQVA